MFFLISVLVSLFLFPLHAEEPDLPAQDLVLLDVPQELVVNNRILAFVEGKSITVWDVMKSMDFFIHQQNPQAFASSPARFQFYTMYWKQFLWELIDRELMLSDAKRMKVTVSDADVREEILHRFGPNTMHVCDTMDMPYKEVKQAIHDEMIVQRMLWIRVHSKALASIGPQAMANAYETYCKEHPANLKWIYQVLSIRSPEEMASEALAQRMFALLHQEKTNPQELVRQIQEEHSNARVQLSAEYQVEDRELSQMHKEVLQTLHAGEYSRPILQKSRGKDEKVHRIFFLKERIQTSLPSFEEMAEKVYVNLLQERYAKEKAQYIARLRERHSFDQKQLLFPENFQPFSLRDSH